MALFEPAIQLVLSNEGGYSDSPKDTGGSTNFGISLRFLRSINNANLRKYGIFKQSSVLGMDDIKDLTQAQAKLIYRNEFWNAAPFSQIESQILCNSVFDMCVNAGIATSIKLLQKAINSFLPAENLLLRDGVLGPKTLSALNQVSTVEVLTAFRKDRENYYRDIVSRNPNQAVFLNSWLHRARE